jgi:integrase
MLPKGEAMAKHTKCNITDRLLKSLKPAADRYDVMDTAVPGFGVRVSGGRKTFVLLTRYPRSNNPTRRALGEYGVMSLEEARDKAREWRKLIKKNIDPHDVAERQRKTTFASVADDFIAYIRDKLKLRTAAVMEHNLRETFITRWGSRPITEITAGDVSRVIGEAVDRDARYQAFRHFALIRRLFNWAIGTDRYGLEVNPCRRLNTGDLIGDRHARDRILTDDELRAFWRATERLGYPYGPLYRLLLLTGLRLGEVCGAQWSEFDLERREWTIPGARMKKTKRGAQPFMVPLTDTMLAVLSPLPRFDGGDYLFSHTGGRLPLKPNHFSDVKERLDAIVLEELRRSATEAGKDAKRVTLPGFVNHDIRRSVRTHLSALRIGEEVREAVLAHVRPGIKGVYDRHQYLDEKREALSLWNARLRSIVEPPPANVVELRGAQ